MSFGVTQIGASFSSPAHAAAAEARAGLSITAQAARGFQVSNVRPAAPVENPAEAREQARQQAMAEHGVDMVSLFKLAPQQRLQVEAAILAETAQRVARRPIPATGGVVDLRV